MAKYKYIEVREKPWNLNVAVTRLDVSTLNKKGINQQLELLEQQFCSDKYAIGTIQTFQEYATFKPR